MEEGGEEGGEEENGEDWGSQNGVVTDPAVTSKSQETSPHGPSPHGFGTSEAPIPRDILGERPESQNRAVTPNPHRLTARCGHRTVWGLPIPPSLDVSSTFRWRLSRRFSAGFGGPWRFSKAPGGTLLARGPPNGVVSTPCGESVGIRGHRTVLGLGSFSEDVSGDWGLQGPKTVR